MLKNKKTTTYNRVVAKCDLLPPSALLTEITILYTDGHAEGQDRQADSSIPPKTFILQGYKKKVQN